MPHSFAPGATVGTLLLAFASAQDPAAAVPAPAKPEAQAQTPEPSLDSREWIGGLPWSQWARATGDWGGYRTWLEEQGIEVGGGLTMDWAGIWHGGVQRRDSVVSLLDVSVALDLDTLLGLPRTLVFFDAQSIEGRDPGPDAGDIQGFTNIQAPDVRQIAEAWLETHLGEQVRLKVGKVDVNSEFAFTEEGGDFINSSAAITPTILGYPTYPNPATSANVFWHPSERCYLGAGIYDGAAADGVTTGTQGFSGFFRNDESNAYFTIAEVGMSWTGGNTWGSGRLALGGWNHSAHFARFDGGTDNGTHGFYAVLDQRLWRENPQSAEDRQGLGLMVGLGFADEDVASISRHAQVGLAWTGLFEGRDDDVLGLLVTHAMLSSATGSTFDGDETAIELLYKVQLTPAISLKPDLQYIVNPSGDPTVDDALVGTLRLEITF